MLFYYWGMPVAAKPTVLFIIADRVNIRVLTQLIDESAHHARNGIFGSELVVTGIHSKGLVLCNDEEEQFIALKKAPG